MKLSVSGSIITLILAACSGNGLSSDISKPFKFDREKLEKLAKEKKAIYDLGKRNNGTLSYEKFYLGDSVKYELNFDEKSNLSRVAKFNEHGEQVWEEEYYPNGQRKSHYNMKTVQEYGRISTQRAGYYETYYETGIVKERGVFNNNKYEWTLKITPEGYAGDTTFYEYPKEEAQDMPKAEIKAK